MESCWRIALRTALGYAHSMTQIVNVPVRAEIADEVRRFAAFIEADRPAATAVPTVTPSDGITDYPLWEDDAIVALARASTTTAANYRKLMDAIISNDAVGMWVSIADLEKWTGLKATTIANFRTHLYRWINAHMPASALAPFTAKRGDKLSPPRGREVHYRVSAACAEQWARVQDQLEGY